MVTSRTKYAASLALLCALASAASEAAIDPSTHAAYDDNAPPTPHFKMSIGAYRTSDPDSALDLNLRWNNGVHTAWIGWYHDSQHLDQKRAGYEYNIDERLVRATFSAQIADGGFFGGSVTGQFGPESLYAVAGFGRTDRHDYVNLNFDPNDMVTFGAGAKIESGASLSIFRIQDDRLGTRQKVTHALAGLPVASGKWLYVDVFYKSGLVDDGSGPMLRHGTGTTLTYDLGRYFMRLAVDPYANFNSSRMVRVTGGMRF